MCILVNSWQNKVETYMIHILCFCIFVDRLFLCLALKTVNMNKKNVELGTPLHEYHNKNAKRTHCQCITTTIALALHTISPFPPYICPYISIEFDSWLYLRVWLQPCSFKHFVWICCLSAPCSIQNIMKAWWRLIASIINSLFFFLFYVVISSANLFNTYHTFLCGDYV